MLSYVMPIPNEQIREIIERSLIIFFEREQSALIQGVNERSSCARLAGYMQAIATDAGVDRYFADTEYNRKQGGQVKTILGNQMTVITINADLILHSRGENVAEDNLIAVEMKKSTRSQADKDADRDRLRAMTKSSYDGIWSNDGTTHPEHVCGYRLGTYVEINVKARTALVEYYVRGEQTDSTSHSF